MPPSLDTENQINSMKEALDKQELKIQTSLVNNEDNISNQAVQQNHHRNPLQTIY